MATDDRLYDLETSDDRRFLVYSSANSYVTPYSSDTYGGELITEFNQRAAMNTLLKRTVDLRKYADIVANAVNNAFGKAVEIDQTTGATEMQGPGLNSFKDVNLHDKENWVVTSYATGCRDEGDFNISIASDDGRVAISSGVALVYGYFVESDSEIKITKVDAANPQDVADVKDNEGQNPENPCVTRFVKLAVQYTAPEHSKHDERLLPPFNGVYQGACIVINDKLPYGNELLLGTVTRDSNGSFLITQNPYRTRMIPLDGIQGAEDYGDLLKAVEDDHIYGIKYGSTEGSDEGDVTNLVDIDKWLWIAFGSNLGRLLRSMSTNEQTAGTETDEATRGIIVSDKTVYTGSNPVVDEFNCLQRIDAKTTGTFARMTWHQAQVPGTTGSDVIDYRALFFQYAASKFGGSSLTAAYNTPSADSTVNKPVYDTDTYPVLKNVDGRDGLMTAQQVAMLELVFDDYINRRSNGNARGRQYGPFLTLEDAKNWFQQYTPKIGVGDYFWVINDTAEAGGTTNNATDDGMENIVTNYGTVSGTVTGTAKQSKLTVPVTGTVTGPVTGTATDSNKNSYDVEGEVEGEVTGNGQGTINATVSGTVTGTLDSFVQNVSSRYVCVSQSSDTNKEARWTFSHAVIMSEDDVVTPWTNYIDTKLEKNIIPGSLTIIPSSDYPLVSNVGLADFTLEVTTKVYDKGLTVAGTGILWTKPSSTADPIEVGCVNYEKGEIYNLKVADSSGTAEARYAIYDNLEYRTLDTDYQYFIQKSGDYNYQQVVFACEAVERGFAVPATSSAFGVVKVGTGSELTDVIVDPNTQRLKITDTLLDFIKNGGFTEQPDTEIPISPNDDLTRYQYKLYPNGVVFKMSGNASDWRAALDTTGTLAHIRGDVTLDFSSVIEDGSRNDGFLLYLEDIDYLTLKGSNLKTTSHVPTETCLFSLNHCKANYPFFTNIGEWKYSQFVSGGDTVELDLPWMMIPQIFTKAINSDEEDKGNSLWCRFASVTMGEHGVCSAMLDVWVKYQGWEDYNGGIDRVWTSLGYVNFPPLFFEYSTDTSETITTLEGETVAEVESRGPIDQYTVIRIPDNLNLRIAGTSGVHQAWDDNNSEFVPSGNFLVNMNWEYNGNPTTAKTRAGKVYLNLYMKNSSVDVKKQNFDNLRFRAPVQIIRLDDNSMSEYVPYEQLFGSVDTSL